MFECLGLSCFCKSTVLRYFTESYRSFRPFRKQVGLEIWIPDFLASLHNPPHGRPHPGTYARPVIKYNAN